MPSRQTHTLERMADCDDCIVTGASESVPAVGWHQLQTGSVTTTTT